jgi:hypothetical protein
VPGHPPSGEAARQRLYASINGFNAIARRNRIFCLLRPVTCGDGQNPDRTESLAQIERTEAIGAAPGMVCDPAKLRHLNMESRPG